VTEPFDPTPRERAVMDQNMAHARHRVTHIVEQTRERIAAGSDGEKLQDEVLDLILAEADPEDWPGRLIVEEVCVLAMLIEAVTAAARR
jgi:hypothetical protein